MIREVPGSGVFRFFLVVLLGAIVALPATGQEENVTAVPTLGPTPVPAPQDELNRGAPRSSMRGFLVAANEGDYQKAAEFLDLRRIPDAERARRGPRLAKELKVVLDRKLWVELDRLSKSALGAVDDGLAPDLDLVGTIDTSKGPIRILLERVSRGDGVKIWKISKQTVTAIPHLWKEFGYGPLGERLPGVLFEVKFLHLELWQWSGLVLGLFVALGLSWLLAAILLKLIRRAARTARHPEFAVDARLHAPTRLIFFVLVFRAFRAPLALPLPLDNSIHALLVVLVLAAVAWLFSRLVDIGAQLVELRLRREGQLAGLAVLPTGRRVVKAFVFVLAALAVFQNLGFNVTGILAGLGVGGLAVALAAQKSLENLFGGITLIADQPVRVGDFCRFGDRVGTVEDVGLRSTRVRTLDRTVVSIPNAQFSLLQLENFARRDKIWLNPKLGLRYETTPDQLRFVLIELKKMLLAHPKVDPDPARVRFSGFGAFSLDLEIFAYVLTTDYNEFLAVREDIFLRIMDIVEASGTGFAFPSQTMYLGSDHGPDVQRTSAAEAQVAAWREQHALYLPDFPAEEAAKIDDSLDYPPAGSPARNKRGRT